MQLPREAILSGPLLLSPTARAASQQTVLVDGDRQAYFNHPDRLSLASERKEVLFVFRRQRLFHLRHTLHADTDAVPRSYPIAIHLGAIRCTAALSSVIFAVQPQDSSTAGSPFFQTRELSLFASRGLCALLGLQFTSIVSGLIQALLHPFQISYQEG